MAIDYKYLGQRIRKRRVAVNMTQAELASTANISTQHMSNIENARTKVSLEKLVDIANGLNVSVDELICDSVIKSRVVYRNEAADILENLNDVELRALPEFLRSFSHFSRLLESSIKEDG